ncbi:MAG: HD domain-containing protein [Calditrichaeota bacterium]|nr:MAG: HD domain-containing protein [Calditrichota bacterium]
MATIERALEIAFEAHKGQKDKAGKPYILHPLRIMSKMPTEELMIIAILHDVVEDSPWTLEDLRKEGFTEEVLSALDCITKRPGEAYEDYMERVKTNRLAIQVKLGDLQDNMDVRRFSGLKKEDSERITFYLGVYHGLLKLL